MSASGRELTFSGRVSDFSDATVRVLSMLPPGLRDNASSSWSGTMQTIQTLLDVLRTAAAAGDYEAKTFLRMSETWAVRCRN